MGGAIALQYSYLYPEDITGVISSSPLLEPGKQAQLNVFESTALKILPHLVPSFALPKVIDGIYLSRDPEVAKQYKLDPLNHGYASMLTGKPFTNYSCRNG